MSNYQSVLNNLIKEIYYKHKKIIKISNDTEKIQFNLDYFVAEKVAKFNNWMYYFGTEIKYSNKEEYLNTYKELLKVKRALREINK